MAMGRSSMNLRPIDEQVIDGLDRALMTMKKGSEALLTIAPEYAYGSSESSQELAIVLPNSTVFFEVELVSFVKEKESRDMNTQEKIEAAGKKKEEGRRKCFVEGWKICQSCQEIRKSCEVY